MKQTRLDSLADGIFAIVMTLLVLEIRVPELQGLVTNATLWSALSTFGPLLLSYVLSFSLLFTYWRAHHFIVSVYAKNIDVRLTSINYFFFLLVAFIPFSAHLLGKYSHTQIAIFIYALNVIFIGLTLLWMRLHVRLSKEIENIDLPHEEEVRGYIRIIVPIVSAVAAMYISIWNTNIAFIMLTFAIAFNLFHASTTVTLKILKLVGVQIR